MTSNITLYQGVEITKDKNFAIQNIDSYLTAISSARKITITLANYVKHNLNIEIPIELSQTYLDFAGKYFNYCRIENVNNGTAEKPAYYFIDSMQWASKNVVHLHLILDTLNTIGYSVKLSNKTLIHREHKDRWEVDGSFIYAKIDKLSENITVPLYKTNETILTDTTESNNFKWYIVYMNDVTIVPTDYNQVIPVRALIAPAHDIEIRPGASFTMSLPMSGQTYTISPYLNNTNKSGTINNLSVRLLHISEVNLLDYSNISSYPLTAYILDYVTIVPSSGSYTITPKWKYLDSDNNVLYTGSGTSSSVSMLTCKNFPGTIYMHVGTENVFTNNYTCRNNTNATILGIDTLDKTDERLIKIIELPYCPIEIREIYNSIYSFNIPLMQESHFNFMEVTGVNLEYYENDIQINRAVFNELSNMRKPTSSGLLWSQTRDISFETKMYHSEIYFKKFLYDSFEYLYSYENADIKNNIVYNASNIKFKQIVSLAVTSKFLFDLGGWYLKDIKDDYPLLAVCTRNNEVTIYNNQYINYLRTGLQYDLKSKAVQDEANVIRTVVSGIGSLGAMVGSAVTANPLGVVMGASTLGNSVYSMFTDSTMREQSLEAKKKQLAMQKTSVSGADDLGLLKFYTKGNWPKVETYQPSESYKNKIWDIFFYTGYVAEYMGVPAIGTRVRFNFIQADIVFDTAASSFLTLNYNHEIIEDYKKKWAEGITILYNNAGYWDFEQKFENWESSIRNYLQ